MDVHVPDYEERDQAFCDICEEVGFILLDPVDPPAVIDLSGPYHQATVQLSGAVQGSVLIAGPLAGLKDMVANVLDVDDEDDPQPAIHFLSELANIAAGVFVGLVTDSTGICDYSIPAAREMAAADWQACCRDAGTRCYASDEGALIWRCLLQETATGRLLRQDRS